MTFLVIGAQKCATSWLYLCLREHPALHLPDRKREVEYLGGELHRRHGDDWYLSLIRPPRGDLRHAGDVSVEYLWDPAAPAEVARLLPDTRLIASMRDPVERAVSAYYWYLRKKRIEDDVGLVQAVERGCAWLEAVEGGGGIDGPPSALEELFARGAYDVQLARWLAHVPAERIMVVDYRDIELDPGATLDAIHAFLGIAPFRPQSIANRPKRNSYAPGFVWLERLLPRSRVWSFVLDRLQRRWPRRAAGPIDALPASLVSRAYRAFAPGMARLETLLEPIPAAQRPIDPSFTKIRAGPG